MQVVEWIEAKKDGRALPDEAIQALVRQFLRGEAPDYQMSAWLMAVAINGMTLRETTALTAAMVASGDTLDLSSIPGIKLDKHSSGGVGDKVTLALVPVAAAAGIPIAKMSGHGLGHTGGTLDKLESIDGFRTALTEPEIVRQVREIGACICAQTDQLAPADRAMYALRDVTGTVASVPLIASSIMSKKIACGADAIVLDVKVGSGAFMKEIDSARELARTMIAVGRSFGKRVSVFITDMDQPLGRAAGNACEVAEVVDLLTGGPVDSRLKELTATLCAEAFALAGKPDAQIEPLIDSGAAMTRLREIVAAQGGAVEALVGSDRTRQEGRVVPALEGGIVRRVDARTIGLVAARLGAGRAKKGDAVDAHAGVWLERVQGERIARGAPMARLLTSDPRRVTPEVEAMLRSAFEIGDTPPEPAKLVIERISSEDRASDGGADAR